MTRLLDVNCLIEVAETGFMRVLANPAYPTVRASLAQIMKRLGEFCAQPGHVFWPDDVSLLNTLDQETRSKLTGCAQITDFYLVSLAAAHGGMLATFDGSLGRSLADTKLGGSIEVLR